jgi:hypothetical protein
MKSEKLKPAQLITFLLMGAALLVALNALVTKFPGQVILPLVKAALLLFGVFIYGFFLMLRLNLDQEKTHFPTVFALGLLITASFFYLVSFGKILVPAVIVVFYVVPLLLLFFILRNHKQAFLQTVRSFFQRPPLEYLAFFLPFIYASLPPSFYDSLVYHLGIPNLYLQHSGFLATPHFLFANTSIYYEISLIPAVFAGDLVPRLFHFMIGVVFLLAAVDFAVEIFALKKRSILLLLLLCMPMSIFLLSTVKNDLVGAFFVFLGIRFLLKDRFGLSALFWGFAIGIKYFNALPLVIFLTLFLIKEKKFPLKKIVVFGLVITAVVVPLLVKNYVFAKNPFFPFFSQIFKSDSWDASRYALMSSDVGKMFHSFSDVVKFPYTVSFKSFGFGGLVGIQFLIFLPFLLVAREKLKKRGDLLLFLFALLTLFAGGFFTGSSRFLYIAFVILSFYLAAVYEAMSETTAVTGKIVTYLFFVIISLNFVTALGLQEQMYRSYQVLSGRLDSEAYKAFTFPAYPGIAYVNRQAEPGAQVMMVGEARNYYLKRPYLVASGIDYPVLKKYLDQAENAESFAAALANDRIRYIIFNLGEFNRLEQEYRGLKETEMEKMRAYFKLLQTKIVFQQNGILVFQLEPGSASQGFPGPPRREK